MKPSPIKSGASGSIGCVKSCIGLFSTVESPFVEPNEAYTS